MKENELLVKLVNLSKIIIGLLIIVIVILIVGVSKMYSNDETTSVNTQSAESDYNTEYDVSMFKEISAKDLKNETKKNLSVVYIGRESCGWCAAFLPNLWDAQEKYKYETLYIDIAKIIDFSSGNVLNQDAFDILSKLTGEGYDGYMEENFGATPMVLIMKDNKIIKAQTGYTEYEAFETMLTEAGIK